MPQIVGAILHCFLFGYGTSLVGNGGYFWGGTIVAFSLLNIIYFATVRE